MPLSICRYVCIPSTTRCTSLSSLLFILIFIKSHILFLHILFVLHILLFCTFLYSIAHFTFYFFFYLYIYIYICSCVVLLLYNFYFIFFVFFALSRPDLTYISLLIIPCIIYHVTNKETLKPWYNVWCFRLLADCVQLVLWGPVRLCVCT